MTSKLRTRVGILVIVVASVIGTTVLAQGPFAPSGNPFNAILAKLDQIIAMLAPDTPAGGPVTLSTGIVGKNTADIASCHIANVSTDTIPNVRIMLLDRLGGSIGDQTFDVPPNESRRVDGIDFNFVRCQFSFVGFENNVRATLAIQEEGTIRSLVALDAR